MVQTYLYYKMYPSDLKQLKALVRRPTVILPFVLNFFFLGDCHLVRHLIVGALFRLTSRRVLDTSHTAFIWSALWSYLIDNYGDSSDINIIHWYSFLAPSYPQI